ncbi:hypothetical protein DRP98_05965 [candidate division KSB1 bacterium]|nr:lysophospholipid acyltransferase family protein [bacterium]OQX58684.1 MAG: hypothetical protein B5M50_03960 [candidate division KSB1 bacterium 4484_219]RKY78417.1 MAG: hypothetical protein DRQ00_05250 [candidate division KSB1 bacterium]RKY83987.1 MAG: hypothetical protein DRP98_05965 [candidate division KSB1 bacterium]
MNLKPKNFVKKLQFYLATHFGWLVILLLGSTLRLRLEGQKYFEQLSTTGKGIVFALWHGRMLVPIFLHRRQGIVALVSQHLDGEMIAQTLFRLGYQTIRGSSTRGGKEAFHKMVASLKQRKWCAVIPDGPRGPRHHFKPGTVYMAQQSGAYILPLTFSAEKKIQFNSWDRFVLPKPFSKTVVIYGKPFYINPELKGKSLIRLVQQIETQMIKLEKAADAYFSK